MPAAAPNDPSPREGGSTVRIDRTAIDAARRRHGHPLGEGPWTACTAPRRVVLLDAAAGPRACEHGRGPAPDDLADRLAAGELSLPHCGGCAEWLADELFATTPALGAHGAADAAAGPTIVVALPATAPALSPEQSARLAAVLPTASALVLATALPVDAPGPAAVLARARELAPTVPLSLRTGDVGVLRSASAAGLALAALEWHATDADPGTLDAVRAAAAACGAAARVRFVLTPSAWHQLEPLARACAAVRLPLDPCVLDRGGVAPLAALGAADLEFVKDVLVAAWPRLGGAGRPASLAEDAFDQLARQLRAALRRVLTTPTADATRATLALPTPAHPWCNDAKLSPWWGRTLLQHGDHPAVRGFVAGILAAPDADATLRAHPWLRALLHRDVAYRRCDDARAALRRLYSAPRERKELGRADAAFAKAVDLAPFGGPWAATIGIADAPARKQPFAVGKPRAAAKGEPRVTVLIPSFKHEAFVADAIRSALAQRGVALRVLVVDDRSPDGTVAAARAIDDPRVEVRENARNLGLGNSTLQALATVTTPYVALLNSDDLFHPDRLARCLAALDADAGAQLVATGMSLVDRDGGELTTDGVSLVLDGKLIHDWVHWYARTKPAADAADADLFGELLERNFLVTSSNLVARADWLRGKADELRSLKYCLDWRLFLAAAAEGSLRRLDEPLLAYRLHEANTVWFDADRRWSYYLEVHRVAAAALAEAAASPRADLAGLVRDVAVHCASNSEVDGFGLLLHRLVDALRLDAVAAADPTVRALVQTLDARRRPAPAGQPDEPPQRALAALTAEQWQAERDERRWLQGYCESLEQRLSASWEERRRLEAEIASHGVELSRVHGVATTRQQRIDALSQLFDALQRDVDALRATLDTVDALQRLVTDELATVRRQRDEATQRAESEQARATTAERNHDAQLARAMRAEVERDAQQTRAELAERAVAEQSRRAGQAEGQRDDQQARAEQAERTVADQVQRAERAEGQRDAQEARAELAERTVTQQVQRAERAEGQRDVERARADAAEAQRDAEHARADAAEAQRDAEHARADAAEAQRDAEHVRADAAEAQRDAEHARADAAEARAAALAGDLGAASQRADQLAGELAAERAILAELTPKAAMLENERKRLLEDLVRTDAERARLQASREWRFGNFVWNKMPLGYISRRGKKWLRRLADLKDRALMRMRRRAEGVAVVAACWEWPIYSHTFVYQEMIGLTHMGLDVRMFHWKLGDVGQLHKAFRYLADHRTELQPVWENHVRDKEHFEKTKPGRLRAFLELVAQRTGRKADELANDPLVMQGCTFARMAELAGAKYLHSYFFYDQSFMVMQAAWLLGIPRGVSCYADHMLDDYPFKLVGLQVELADVVVATSARIKRELSAKSGGKHDDKIIVKPNGVDGARFPAVERPTRAKGDRFEAISISRIEPKKGLTYLVEAVADLTRRGHDVVVHVVGSKDVHSKGSLEYAEGFERRIAELGMQERVVLHGMKKQEELAPLLQRSRAFVAPYVEVENGDKDGIPTAMLEGLASGLPVVTTDSGSILEVVDAGVEGIVVKQRDAKGLADAFEKLITDPALERRMAKAARARFDREFDIRVTERKLHERVAGLLQRVGKPR